ncbi:hypothetical protein SEA_LILMARTIN_241 [Streptomyces phage LilMartin]|nr:hypothetical protein SEA_LILMARTIN_241 [Streptomyces phage LilMartin]QNO12628.1 hypothetical protein SEA_MULCHMANSION_245 [Streptomyces phage MulchMansion]UVK61296.1 hypothetical protein SEA_ANGELA_245 [Streptomyces phage Angela]
MEEREKFVLTPASSIVDSPHEAIKNLNISVTLLRAILKETLLNSDLPIDNDTVDALDIIEQTTASVDMYLERLGMWKS